MWTEDKWSAIPKRPAASFAVARAAPWPIDAISQLIEIDVRFGDLRHVPPPDAGPGRLVGWRREPAPEIRHSLAAPALSHRGNLAALAVADPGTNESFQIVVIDLANGDRRMTPLDRRANGPPVWIDDASVLVEVLPIPGGTPFLRLDPATGAVKPVAADGYGPAISGDGSVLALASTDGSVLAVPTARWLAGTLPDGGAVVDASGSPFQLAVDASGRRLAIGYADAAGDPASIAIFVREGEGWRRSAARVQVAAGTVTMLGWLN